MSITVTNARRDDIGNQYKISGTATFDASYATGGETLTAAQLGLTEISGVIMEDSLGYTFDTIRNTSGSQALIRVYDSATITPAGTNAASTVQILSKSLDTPYIALPEIALVHNADPVTNLDAAPLFADPLIGVEMAQLESIQDSAADTYFSTSNDGSYYQEGTLRAYGLVIHNATPGGAQIYVDEADSDKLKADFTGAGAPGDKLVPLRLSAGVIFLNIIDEDTTAMTELYYDDNGADNAKLVFVDAGTAGGVVHGSNIIPGAYAALPASGIVGGISNAQAFTGTPVSAAPLTEVANGTNLSAVSVDFIAIGK